MNFENLSSHLLANEPPRSQPFIEGMAAVLRNRVDQTPVTSPYSAGTADDDAFFAGRMRGHNEFRNLLIEHHGDRQAVIAHLRDVCASIRRAA